MYFIFDLLFLMFYAAYKGTKFDKNGLLEGQASTVLGFTICLSGGLFLNYFLAEHWALYRSTLIEYPLLFGIFPIFYVLAIYWLVTRRYMKEELPASVSERLNMFSVPAARFFTFLYFLLFFGATIAVFVYTAYAFAK